MEQLGETDSTLGANEESVATWRQWIDSTQNSITIPCIRHEIDGHLFVKHHFVRMSILVDPLLLKLLPAPGQAEWNGQMEGP